jgi:hypothetical protein
MVDVMEYDIAEGCSPLVKNTYLLNIAAVVAYVVSTSILNILNDPERMHEI